MLDQEQAARFYKRKQIESATPGQLVLLLYEGAIDHINRAELAMADSGPDTIEKFHNHLITCQNIVTELIVSLDMEKGGDIAQNLFRLYEYINFRLVKANISKSMEILKEVKDLLSNLKLAWAQVIEKESSHARPRQNLGLNLQG
ncbi:MAG: flagellar protein FliS [Chlamydiales bacterium]|jgi:flagellar protein FliS|nr:flagellar protein FliS [Chlamydiales bacterium]